MIWEQLNSLGDNRQVTEDRVLSNVSANRRIAAKPRRINGLGRQSLTHSQDLLRVPFVSLWRIFLLRRTLRTTRRSYAPIPFEERRSHSGSQLLTCSRRLARTLMAPAAGNLLLKTT